MLKQLYLLLIIYSLFSFKGISQNLTLKINGQNEEEITIINNFNYNKSHNDYNSITAEVSSLHKKIIKSGYIESIYSIEKKTNNNLIIVSFKLNTKYNNIKIDYNSSEINKSIIDNVSDNSFNEYFIIPFEKIETTLNSINKQISDSGFTFSKIKLSEIIIKDKFSLNASLIINKDEEKRRLDAITIKGYKKFPNSYLKHYLNIKSSNTFNIETIKKKVNALNNLRFANQIKAPEVLFTKDSTTLYLYIEKNKSNSFDGFLGFSTNEETNKLDFNGYLNLDLVNNFNYGESLRLVYKSDESEQRNFNVNISLPYILKSPIGTELELGIFRKDSSFTTVSQKAKLFYLLNSQNSFFAGIETIKSNNLLEENNTITEDYDTNFFTFKYNFENRKNYNVLFQLKSALSIDFGLGTRKLENSKEKQNKIIVNTHHIFNLNAKNSIFIKFNGAILNSNSYFENELYRFGGINSIRGFQENSLEATQFGVLNTEYRYKLSNSIYTHTIIDFASLNNEVNNYKENLYGFGLGFGILTKAGLLRFIYANGKTKNQQFKISNSKIHLSLVSVF